MNEWEELIRASEMEGKYFRTDPFHDVFASLVLLRDSLHRLQEEPAYWKWAILSAHSALQGVCVCFLTRTDQGGALEDSIERKLLRYDQLESQKEMAERAGIEWILGDPEYPELRIASLPELLKRLPSEIRASIPKQCHSAPDHRTRQLCWLHSLRNGFVHFEPVHKSIEIAGLPQVLGTTLELIQSILRRDDFRSRNRFSEFDLQATLGSIKLKLSEFRTVD